MATGSSASASSVWDLKKSTEPFRLQSVSAAWAKLVVKATVNGCNWVGDVHEPGWRLRKATTVTVSPAGGGELQRIGFRGETMQEAEVDVVDEAQIVASQL